MQSTRTLIGDVESRLFKKLTGDGSFSEACAAKGDEAIPISDACRARIDGPERQSRGRAESDKVMRRRERDERRARGQLKQKRERIFAYIEVPSTYRVVRERDRESRIHLPAQQLQRERRRLVAWKDARPGQH